MQVLNKYLESTKKQIEEEISAAAEVIQAGSGPYTVQQEQPETEKQLSEVKARMSELMQQNSKVPFAVDLEADTSCMRTSSMSRTLKPTSSQPAVCT